MYPFLQQFPVYLSQRFANQNPLGQNTFRIRITSELSQGSEVGALTNHGDGSHLEEEILLFFPRKELMKSHGIFVHSKSFQLPFRLYESDFLTLMFRDIQVTLHGCRPQIYWSWINIFARDISGSLFVLCQHKLHVPLLKFWVKQSSTVSLS